MFVCQLYTYRFSFFPCVSLSPTDISYTFHNCNTCLYKVIFYVIPDNRLRIAFNDNSATQGRLEIFHGSAWGAVCDDGFDMNEAQTACLQLGYDVADNFVDAVHSGPLTYLLDEVRCYPNHARLQDCVHNRWGVHDCSYNEGIEVICSGGSKYLL